MRQESIHHRDHLLLQMQRWAGPRLQKEGLVPPPPGERGHPHFGYLGDLQLSLVFRPSGAAQLQPINAQDLSRLGLTPGRAVTVAAANIRRLVGEPHFIPMGSRVQALRCALPECTAACLLDRALWLRLLERHPQGLIAALPRNGLFMFAPAGDPQVEDELTRRAAKAYATAGRERLSTGIYRYDQCGWQSHAEFPALESVTSTADLRDTEPRMPLHMPAPRQKMLMHHIRLGVARLGSTVGLRSARV